MRVASLCLLLCLLLLGCAGTPEALRSDVGARRVYVLPVGYQQALKNLVDQHQNCEGGPFIPLGQVVNEVSHYPDLRRASIVRGAMGFGRQIHLVIDLSEPGPGRTRMEIYALIGLDNFARQAERVAMGNLACGYP